MNGMDIILCGSFFISAIGITLSLNTKAESFSDLIRFSDLINFSDDVLLAAVATSITAYIFMFETNRRLQTNHPGYIESINMFEDIVRRLITQTFMISIILVILRALLENDLISLITLALSTMMMLSNLATTSSIILSRSIISIMSISGPKGAVSRYHNLEFGYCYHRPSLFFFIQDSIVNNQGRPLKYVDVKDRQNTTFDTIHVNTGFIDLAKAVEPDDIIIHGLLEKKMYSKGGTLEVCRALVQGRKRVEQRLIQYTMIYDNLHINHLITEVCHPSNNHSKDPAEYRRRADLILEFIPSFTIEDRNPKVDNDDVDCINQLLYLHKLTHRPELIIHHESNSLIDLVHYTCVNDGEAVIADIPLDVIWRNNYLTILCILNDYYSKYLMMKNAKKENSSHLRIDQEMEPTEGADPCSESLLYRIVQSYMEISTITRMIDAAHHFDDRRMKGACDSEFRCLSYLYYHALMKKFFFNKPLKDLDLSGVDLSNASFYGSNMEGCDFTSSRISGSDFTECNLRSCTWLNVRLSPGGALFNRTDFTGSIFGRINMDSHSSMKDARFSGSVINRGRFTGMDMRGTNMDSMTLGQCQFRSVMMDVMTIRNSTLDRCIFVPERPLDIELVFIGENTKMECVRGMIEIRLYGAEFNTYGNEKDRTLWSNRLEDLYSGIISDCICMFRDITDDSEMGTIFQITLSRKLGNPHRYVLSFDTPQDDCPNESSDICFLDSHIDPYRDTTDNYNTKGCDIEGSKIIGTDLTNSIISNSNMRNCLFSKGGLLGTMMSKVQLDESTFLDFELRNTITVRGRFFDCSFRGTHWDRCLISETEFISSAFDRMVMRNMSIINSEFENCDFREVIIEDSTLEDVEIDIQKLSKGDHSLISFSKCYLVRTYITLPDEIKVIFRECEVGGYLYVERNGFMKTIPCGFHSELIFE